MSSIPNTGNTSTFDWLNASGEATPDRMNDLSMSDFIRMMVAELENQDPMNPMSNTEMLAQISQMRSITSNEKLSATVEALAMGQSLATASSMIGKTITGVDTLGQTVTGVVDKVVIEDGSAKLYVGSSVIRTQNVTAIGTPGSSSSDSPPGDEDKTDDSTEPESPTESEPADQ